MISKLRRKLFARRARKELFGVYKRAQQGPIYQYDELGIIYIIARYHLDMRLAFPEKTEARVIDSAFSLALGCWHIAENDRRKEKIEAERAERRRVDDEDIKYGAGGEQHNWMIGPTGGGKWAEYIEEERKREQKRRSQIGLWL